MAFLSLIISRKGIETHELPLAFLRSTTSWLGAFGSCFVQFPMDLSMVESNLSAGLIEDCCCWRDFNFSSSSLSFHAKEL